MAMESWDGEQETVTEEWRASSLFTNRVAIARRFMSYLNDDPDPASILLSR